MSALTIKESKNYRAFINHHVNRDVKKIKMLKETMSRYGWVDAYPMHCVMRADGKIEIKGGHHRFEVAEMLGLPVKYVVCNDGGITIQELERATVPWSFNDFVTSYARAGHKDVDEVKRFCEASGIPLGSAFSMFGGEWAGSSNVAKAVRNGVFKIKDREHPRAVAAAVKIMRAAGIEWASTSLLVQALSKVLRLPEVTPTTLNARIKKNVRLITRKASLDEYMRLLEVVYNHRAPRDTQLPLKFYADQAAKLRSATGDKKSKGRAEAAPVPVDYF